MEINYEDLIELIIVDTQTGIDYCQLILSTAANFRNFREFYDYHLKNAHISTCQSSWSAETISIHCDNCGKEPNSCSCLQCFLNGNHQGHEYSISRSSIGNCDCGDRYFWKPSGFCKHHHGLEENSHPEDYLDKKLQTLLTDIIFKASFLAIQKIETNDVIKLSAILQFLNQFLKFGDGFRRLLSISLTEKINFEKFMDRIFEFTPQFNSVLVDFLGSFTNDDVFRNNFAKINYKLMIDKIIPLIYSRVRGKNATVIKNISPWKNFWFHSYEENLIAKNLKTDDINWIEYLIKILNYTKELFTFQGLNYKGIYTPNIFHYLNRFSNFAMNQTDEEKQILFDKFVVEILSKNIDNTIITTTFDSYIENETFDFVYSFDSFFYDFIQTFKSSEKVKFDKMFEIFDKIIDISTIFQIGKNSVGNKSGNENDKFIYYFVKPAINANQSTNDAYFRSFSKGSSSFFVSNPLINSLAYMLRNDECCRLKIAEFLSLEKYQRLRIQIGIATLKSLLAMVCLSQSLVPKTNSPSYILFSIYVNNPYLVSKGIPLLFPLLQLVIGIQCNENSRFNEFTFKEFFAFEMAREIGIFDDFNDDSNEGNKKQMIFAFLYLSLLLVSERILFNFDSFKFNKEQIKTELKQGVSDLNKLNKLFDNSINPKISSFAQINKIIKEVATARQRNSTKNFKNNENDVSFVLKEGIEVNFISAINSFNKQKNLMDNEIKKHPDQLIKIQPFEPDESYFFKHSEKVNVSLKEFLITPTVFSIVYKTLRKSSESHSNELNDHLAMNILLLISKFVKDSNFHYVDSVKSILKTNSIIKYKSSIDDLIIQLEKSVFGYSFNRNGSFSIQNTINKETFDLLLKTKIKSLNETPKSIVDILIEKGELGKNVLKQMGIEIENDDKSKQDYANQMKKARAKKLKENIMIHFKSVSSSFSLNESNENDDDDEDSNSEKEDICSICSLTSKEDILSYPLYIYRTKFPFIFDKPPLVEMTKLNSLKEADILQDIDIVQPPNIKEDDYEDEKDIVPDTDTMMTQFLSNSPIFDITNNMNDQIADFARNTLDHVHQIIVMQHDQLVQQQNERKNKRKQAKINQFQREKDELIKKQNNLINPNSIVSKRCTAGNLFVIQFGICQHLVHPNCVQQDDFTCPMDRSFKNGFLPNIEDLTDDIIYANVNDKTFENFSEKFKETLNIFINKYSFFFRASEDKIIDLFVELVKSLSGLIVTYEVRLRSLPDCLDSKKTKILARNLFLTTWYAYRMRGKPTMKTGFNDDVSEKVDLKLTVFQRFIKKLIETDEIEKDISTKDKFIKQIVSSFVQSSFKEEKEKCLFLRRVCLADHFLLKNKEKGESRIELKNHELIDWDEILTLQNLSEKYNVPFKDLSEEFVFKPFIFSKMPKEFLRFAKEPYNFPVDQTTQLTIFNILDYNNMIANYDDMNENAEVDVDYLNELNIVDEKKFDLSIHKLFSDKNYPSVLLFIGKKASSICVVDGKRICYMRPFYLDRFGCTDIGYCREQPLFLNDERYERFMDQILSGEFSSNMEKF